MSFRSGTPKVSILSAVQNEERYLAEMVESVQRQAFNDWELIFVDDRSTDLTAACIRDFAALDSRVRFIHQGALQGKVASFNCAFEASRGEVILLLAGDDRLADSSLATRWAALSVFPRDSPAVGFFKIRSFSDDPRFDNMLLPRGNGVSRSGGAIAMNRALANIVFPICEDLPSEDIWLAYASEVLAENIAMEPAVVLEYRIHAGNSNPRHKSFSVMNESMHARHDAWRLLLECSRMDFPASARRRLSLLWTAEQLRYSRRLVRLIMLRGLPLVDRLGLAAMGSPLLFFLRRRLYRFFSGWREGRSR